MTIPNYRYVAGIGYEGSYDDSCVRYFDTEDAAKAHADSLDFYDATYGDRSRPSAYVRRHVWDEGYEQWGWDESYEEHCRELIDTIEEAYLKWREQVIEAILELPGVILNARYFDGIYIDVGNGRTMRIKDHVGRQGRNWQCTYNAYFIRENQDLLDPETMHFRPSSGVAVVQYVQEILQYEANRT